MTVNAVEGAAVLPWSSAGVAKTDAATTTSDKDLFLSLLVAQMRYQDPMNPADSSAFLTQTATFTQVEKLQQVADQTAALLSAQNAFGASSLVGRTISWTDSSGATLSGPVNGVSFGTDGPVLDVDGNQVPLSAVLSVTATAAATTPTTGADTHPGTDSASS